MSPVAAWPTGSGQRCKANLLRSERDVDTLTAVGVHVRLVKGVYLEPAGIHPYGEATDVAYLQLGFRLHEAGAAWSMATHDGRLREAGCSSSARCQSSSCSECAQKHSTSSWREGCQPVSTFRTDPTGSATGSAESPNPAAPDATTRHQASRSTIFGFACGKLRAAGEPVVCTP